MVRGSGLVFAFFLTCGTAFGWGCEGHQIIALMARAQLKPSVSTAVDALLRENPIDPKLSRFCKDRPSDLMADSATWADDARNFDKTAAWHFVDIPRSETRPKGPLSIERWCPEEGGKDGSGCVTHAIEQQLAILKDRKRPAPERAKALRYVIHFVEDTHQPLHDSDNNDHGGNCTAMRFFDDEKAANLHAIWDYRLIERDMAARKLDQPGYAAQLAAEFAQRSRKWSREKADPVRWAWDGHDIAVRQTYGLLSPAIPVETPGPDACDDERKKVAALHIEIGQTYFDGSMPTIRELLAQSAARLAAVLNQAF